MRGRFNYLYFGFFFVALLILHLNHLFVMEVGSFATRLLFSVLIVCQSVIEALVLGFIAALLPRSGYYFVALVTFLLLLSHLVDFFLSRLMGISVWYAVVVYVFDETWANFRELLLASKISMQVWLLSGLAVVALLSVGVYFSHFTQRLSQKRPLFLSYRVFVKALSSAFLGLIVLNLFAVFWLQPELFERHVKALPWKSVFFSPHQEEIALQSSLKPLQPEKQVLEKLQNGNFLLQQNPDLFLIVVESLRESFLTASTAPHLYRFKEENTASEFSFANSNGTQISWFSLFYSQQPFYWKQAQQTWQSGSPALRILKNAGYQIHVYSSSRLAYYHMDELLFGKESIVDSLNQFSEEREPWQCDTRTMEQLQKDLREKPKGGNLFIVFLESTHFDYSWPPTQESVFMPFPQKIDYLKISCSKEGLEGIKNRYRNAIYYVDSLFGELLGTLKETDRWDDAALVITGDHGEEFFEEGHLFHASHLCDVQTRVPIYYRLRGLENKKMSSHMDIFPTLLHYVVGEDRFGALFQGNSLFKSQSWPFVISARYNAGRSPYEFYIHDGNQKLTVRFCNERELFTSNQLRIVSVKNKEGEPLSFTHQSIQEAFGPALRHLCLD